MKTLKGKSFSIVAICAVAGGLLGWTHSAGADVTAAACQCTISGSSEYDCSTPSACGAGVYSCKVVCTE